MELGFIQYEIENKRTTKFDYLPENCPLTNTWTACPADCTLMLGFCPPLRDDSDALMSTLQHAKPENSKISNAEN